MLLSLISQARARLNIETARSAAAPFELGEKIGAGKSADVYVDLRQPGKVIKALHLATVEQQHAATEECELFQRVYGEGSAALIQHGGRLYLKMDRLPGDPVSKMTHFPPDAVNFFIATVQEMESKHIFHADLTPDNVHYCADTNRFYPLDFSNNYHLRQRATADEGDMLDDEYRYRIDLLLNRITHANVVTVSLAAPPALGSLLGRGDYGHVYQDQRDSRWVWKKFNEIAAFSLGRAQLEASAFTRYYGPDVAQVLLHDENVYIKMLKVPGEVMNKIGIGGYAPEAEQAFYRMLSTLADARIMHNDLYTGNLMYHRQSNTFYPIDFEDHYHSYFMANQTMKGIYNRAHQRLHDDLLTTIRQKSAATYSQAP